MEVFSENFLMHLMFSVECRVRQVCPDAVEFTRAALIRIKLWHEVRMSHLMAERERLDTHQQTSERGFEGRGKLRPSSANLYLPLKTILLSTHEQSRQLMGNTGTGRYFRSPRLMRD